MINIISIYRGRFKIVGQAFDYEAAERCLRLAYRNARKSEHFTMEVA